MVDRSEERPTIATALPPTRAGIASGSRNLHSFSIEGNRCPVEGDFISASKKGDEQRCISLAAISVGPALAAGRCCSNAVVEELLTITLMNRAMKQDYM
jgi:hypothetical protein